MQDLEFNADIAAPIARVWDCMFDPLAYRDWTRAFAEGSYYEGSWETGRRLRFLDPRGFGMEAVVDESRPHELVRLRLVGELRDGRPLADSPLIQQPVHESYHFAATPAGGTRVTVRLQGWDSFRDFLLATWPRALDRLKTLSETPT